MSWSNSQKGRVHQYKGWAGLTDHQYRAIIYQHAHTPPTQEHPIRSAGDTRLTELDFDYIMAAIEGALEEAIEAGRVDVPATLPDLHYWRNRCPSPERPSTRQIDTFKKLANAYLGVDDRKQWGYIVWLLRRIAGRDTVQTIEDLSCREAEQAIRSIRGRLRRHIADRGQSAAVQDLM